MVFQFSNISFSALLWLGCNFSVDALMSTKMTTHNQNQRIARYNRNYRFTGSPIQILLKVRRSNYNEENDENDIRISDSRIRAEERLRMEENEVDRLRSKVTELRDRLEKKFQKLTLVSTTNNILH
jgi:hypothetical protein